MKRRLSIIGLFALASCTIDQKQLTFWEDTKGTVIVHHVTKEGKDHEEKLTKKPTEDIDGRYFKVDEMDSTFKVAEKKAKPPKDKVDTSKLEDKIADLKREVDELRGDRRHEDVKDKPTASRNVDQNNAVADADPSPSPAAFGPLIREGQ